MTAEEREMMDELELALKETDASDDKDLAAILNSAEFSGVLPTTTTMATTEASTSSSTVTKDSADVDVKEEASIKEEGEDAEGSGRASGLRSPSPSALGALGGDGDDDGKSQSLICTFPHHHYLPHD